MQILWVKHFILQARKIQAQSLTKLTKILYNQCKTFFNWCNILYRHKIVFAFISTIRWHLKYLIMSKNWYNKLVTISICQILLLRFTSTFKNHWLDIYLIILAKFSQGKSFLVFWIFELHICLDISKFCHCNFF